MITARDARVARHEACHTAAMHYYGWPVRGVLRMGEHGGLAIYETKMSGDVRARGEELATILYVPVCEDPSLSVVDLRKIAKLTDAGVRLVAVIERAEKLMADRSFKQRVHRVELALYSHPVLSSQEVADLLS